MLLSLLYEEENKKILSYLLSYQSTKEYVEFFYILQNIQTACWNGTNLILKSLVLPIRTDKKLFAQKTSLIL